MYEGAKVELKMEKTILMDGVMDESTYQCQTLTYDRGEEFVYLSLLNGELLDISLDAIYKCNIVLEENAISCDGMVKERYRSEDGNILIFQVENGFYKINLK